MSVRVIFVLILLALSPGLSVAASPKSSQKTLGLRVFSGLVVHPTEGDVNGLQIIFVPSDFGDKIIWRFGAGRVNAPLVLDVSMSGDVWKVTVPPGNDVAGDWTLLLKGGVLQAIGPRDLKFTLKEMSIR